MKLRNYLLHSGLISMFLMLLTCAAYSQANYVSEDYFVVSWGASEEAIHINWVGVDHFVLPPVPVTVSETAGILFSNTNGNLTWFNIDGSFKTATSFKAPNSICINGLGDVLCSDPINLYYFDSDLQHIWTLPIKDVNNYYDRKLIWRIFPCWDDNFWCIYDYEKDGIRKAYLVKVFTDGTLSDPTLVYEAPTHESITYSYVSPDGIVSPMITDMCGYTYSTYRKWQDGKAIVKLTKRSPEGNIVYSNQIPNDPGCEGIPDFFIMWSGNYFTWHGSEEGMKLTKYTLQPE